MVADCCSRCWATVMQLQSDVCTDHTSLRIRVRKPWIPWCAEPMKSCAKTTANLACTALLVIQYFCARVVGVWIMNSSLLLSYVAVVCISTALLPAVMQRLYHRQQGKDRLHSICCQQPETTCRSLGKCWCWVPCMELGCHVLLTMDLETLSANTEEHDTLLCALQGSKRH